MEIAYTAHTETCTLLLDAGGVCRSVLAVSSRAAVGGSRPTRIPSSAERCVGAQYVATLDLREPGGMTAMPLPGSQMLFARTEPNGRISLIRSAPVVRFEAIPTRVESGIHARPEGNSRISISEDEELTLSGDAPTIPRGYRSSLPPMDLPQRDSGVVPAGTVRRTSIPPPPRSPYMESSPDSETETSTRPVFSAIPTPPPPSPTSQVPRPSRSRPSIVRITASSPSQPTVTELEIATRPYQRGSRLR